MRNAKSAGVLYVFKGVHTLRRSEREREREREIGREREKVRTPD